MLMICKICGSSRVNKIEIFKPYVDREWLFEIYDCSVCQARFALRDNVICYHEEIHSSKDSSYNAHYQMAKEVKKLIDTDINRCKEFLDNRSQVLKDLFLYISERPKEINILEVGCSSGYVTAFLQKWGYINTLGIDISSTAIEYANSTFGNFYSMEKEDKKYDVIFHTGVIGCVDNPTEFLAYYLESLKSNGIMFFNAPNVDSVYETNELWVSTPPPDLIYLFKESSLKKNIDSHYDVEIKKTFTPANIIVKYIKRYKKKKNNIYPRNFIISQNNILSKNINPLIKKSIFYLVTLLVRLKILKNYSDEYGLIVKIKRKSLC
jgi:SAM-dependent methyltransferase